MQETKGLIDTAQIGGSRFKYYQAFILHYVKYLVIPWLTCITSFLSIISLVYKQYYKLELISADYEEQLRVFETIICVLCNKLRAHAANASPLIDHITFSCPFALSLFLSLSPSLVLAFPADYPPHAQFCRLAMAVRLKVWPILFSALILTESSSARNQ